MRREDDLDVRLMRELASPQSFRWDVRESYSSIARRLGVDEETVRRRLKLAERSGVLQGFQLIPNPHLFKMESAAVELEVERTERKSIALSQIKLVEGVILVVDFHGERLRTVFYYDNERSLARKLQLLSSICGDRGERHWTERFPPCNIRMRETDWRILESMRKEARRSLSEVAERIGVSTRTVKRRLTAMTQGNAFYLSRVQ
jgi:DNA-binding Lrp family transcriptional regulator